MSTSPSPDIFTLQDGSTRREGTITHTPFTFGRLPENEVVLTHPYVSRRHAEIVLREDGYYIADLGSRHGTFVNGQQLAGPHRLTTADTVHFGTLTGPSFSLRYSDQDSASSIHQLLYEMPDSSSLGSGLEKLRWFVESARRLNATGSVEQILSSLLETTLQLTRAERAYVFLRDEKGVMTLALGRDSKGDALVDDSTVSHGAMNQAVSTARDYIVTDTMSAEQRSDSIVAQSIRTVICIPLRKPRGGSVARNHELLGLLYLDNRLRVGSLTEIDSDLLKAIATDAAALIDNTQLAVAEESERRHREELSIAAQIQRSLMAIKMPSLSYAELTARWFPCREVGGDFFDVVTHADSVSVVVADISGKGISAALLASTLQGMIYAQLVARQPLADIASTANRYIREKGIGKYATMIIIRLNADGQMEYINCGHVAPVICKAGDVMRLPDSNVPVGLLDDAVFLASIVQLAPGTRVLGVTDGVTESQNRVGDFFEEYRLEEFVRQNKNLDEILSLIETFCGSLAADDDCTMLEIRYTGVDHNKDSE